MSIKLSKRSDVENFRALDNLRTVNERVQRGEDIIRLEAGQPCFGAPKEALNYARECLMNDPVQGYTDAIGSVFLRERIARHYREFYDIDLGAGNIAVTVGSSAGFILSFLAIFEAGDKIGIINPTYPAYRNILKALDLRAIELDASASDNYQPTAELLEHCPEKLDGLIINSPANPTGTMLDEAELERICQWCADNGVRLISDEAYHGITYEEKAQSALKYNKDAIVLNTFSKYFALTGWRLGWLAIPEDVAARVKKLAENLFVSPPTISQHVAFKTFDYLDVLDDYVRRYRENRDILKLCLPEAGITNLSAAKGAFYFYADVGAFTNDSEEFCRRMLDEAKVACTAGIDFDAHRGHTTIRISYAGTPENMAEAGKRLKQWLA